MNKKWVIIGLVALAALAVYLFLRSRSSASAGSDEGNEVAPGGSTDLNSVAPELVGGSSGPTVNPAVQLPVNITLTEQAANAPKPQKQDVDMTPGKGIQANPIQRQVGASQPANLAASDQAIEPDSTPAPIPAEGDGGGY